MIDGADNSRVLITIDILSAFSMCELQTRCTEYGCYYYPRVVRGVLRNGSKDRQPGKAEELNTPAPMLHFPLRFAPNLTRVDLCHCMQSKVEIFRQFNTLGCQHLYLTDPCSVGLFTSVT